MITLKTGILMPFLRTCTHTGAVTGDGTGVWCGGMTLWVLQVCVCVCDMIIRSSDTGRGSSIVHAHWSISVFARHVSVLRLATTHVCSLYCQYVYRRLPSHLI